MSLRNYDIAELRRLDVAHHLPAHQDHGLMRDLGGARIITRAEGSTIYDGDGVGLLDGSHAPRTSGSSRRVHGWKM